MTDTSRTFYEYPPTHASINVLQPKALNDFQTTKTKRSWGELLKIPTKPKRDRENSSGRTAAIYAAGVNLSPSNGYSPGSYTQQVQYRPAYTPHEYKRNYEVQYNRNKYNSAEYLSPSPVAPSPPLHIPPLQTAKSNKTNRNLKNGSNSIRYTDWFGSIATRKQPVRPSLQNLIQYTNDPPRHSWGAYVSPQTQQQQQQQTPANVIDTSSGSPLRVYSNVCLCPDQLFSTKSKKRKKCKKCGCKNATIKNATATATPNKIRPAIPHNLYQAPTAVVWNWPQYEQQAAYAITPYVVQPYLNGLRDSEGSTCSSPELAESVKSLDSTATFTNRSSSITPTKSIPPPPFVPLPPTPTPHALQYLDRSEKVVEKNSIISDCATAYDLMEGNKRRTSNSESDELSDNAIEESFESPRPQTQSQKEQKSVSIIEIDDGSSPSVKINSKNMNSSSNNDLRVNRNEGNKIKIVTTAIPNGNAGKVFSQTRDEESVKRDKLSYLSFQNNSLISPATTISSPDSNVDQRSKHLKRKSRTGLNAGHQLRSSSSEFIESSHVKTKNRNTPGRTLNDGVKTFDPKIPHRDESKVICIAGQRILFDKNLASKQNDFSNSNSQSDSFGIESWEAYSDNSWDSQEHDEKQKTQTPTSKKQETSKRQTSPMKGLFKNGEIKRNTLVSFGATNTIHEENEDVSDDERDHFVKGKLSSSFERANESQSDDESAEDLPMFSSIHEESEDTEKEGRSSSSTSSPERRENFKPTLSELLQVKSILKRPNSVDTSSETDSDIYLPTFSEYRKEQKKKKSVQFQHSDHIALDEESERTKGESSTTPKVHNIRQAKLHRKKESESDFLKPEINNGEDFEDDSKLELDPRSPESNSNGQMSFEEEKSSNAALGYVDLNPGRKLPSTQERAFKGLSRLVKNNSLLQKGVTVPLRPTVPPPPPPPSAKTNQIGIEAVLSSCLDARNDFIKRELEKSLTSKAILTPQPPTPPETPPPPLPLSPPPALSSTSISTFDSSTFGTSDSFRTFSSFRDPNSDASLSLSSQSSTSYSQTPLLNFEAIDDISSFSKTPPVFSLPEEEESHIATIRGRVKPSRPSLPPTMIYPPSERIGIFNTGIHSHDSENFIQGIKGSSASSSSCPSSQSSSQKSFTSSMLGENDTDDHFSDHIYEELPSLTSSPIGDVNMGSFSQEKSIFDGASKYEILEFLQDAKRRVDLDEEDSNVMSNEILENHLVELKLDDEDEQVPPDCHEDSLSPCRYKNGRSSNRSSNSDSSENSGLLRFDKERLPAGEIERTDSGVGSETSKPNLKIRRNQRSSTQNSCLDFSGTHGLLRDRELPPCDDCDSPVEAKVTNSGLMYAPLVCRRCSRRRQERKEIILEIMETELKYGRDLRVMVEQFYRPMQVAALLTRDQLGRIFLNIEDLIEQNTQFTLQLRDAYEIAIDQGDEDLLTVNVAKLFLQASEMLHTFQNYCVKQSAASLLLQTLEKERELLRIFLKVSQMENTLLRRMNLHSFLMVPVQRITKYPLLLSRLFKATPPSHSSREDCRRAREKVELFLHHINSETKDTSPTKLWRRISLSVGGGSSSLVKRPLQPPDYDASLKIRAVALEVLEWRSEDAYIVREGRLQCLPPESNNWTRRGRGLKMVPVQMVLLTLGRPTSTLEEEIPEDGLVTPRDLGIREAAILAFKDNRVSKSSLLRDPWLLTRNVLSWDEEGETEFFEITDLSLKESYVFKDRETVSTAEWFRLLQFHALSVGSWKRRRKALPNIMIHGAKRPSC